MKRTLLFIATALFALSMSATDLTGKRIYINPGHGSFGPNDRPMATIPYPNLTSTGMPDTCGFYESNTNLWKGLYLGQKLQAAGATVLYSRTECGPWPYAKVDGQYPNYSWEDYGNRADYTKYNRSLSEICEEVEANNIDYFISIHSNAATDGTTANYPLFIYRGYDDISTTATGTENIYVDGSREKAEKAWSYRNAIMLSGIDPSTAYKTSANIRGDINFYGSSSTRTSASSGTTYRGYLGVLKHGASGYLVEGYFHTYQPARHRALNPDYCHQEGLAYYRGIIDYYGADPEKTGYIMGTVKDLHNKISNSLFNYAPKTNDQWLPCNGAVVTLYKSGKEIASYNVDTLYNGLFVFENLTPGDDYTLDATCAGYKPLGSDFKEAFSVKANETTYPMIYLEDTAYVAPTVFYENYPNPTQPSYLQVAGSYEMQQSFVGKPVNEVLRDKTIRRVLYRDGSMFILAVDAAKQPTLVEVDAETQVVKNTFATDFCSVVSTNGYKLSDIAFTADGYLIGCSMEHTAFDASTVSAYGDEGTYNDWNIYKWENNAAGWTGALWFATKTTAAAGNFYNAYTGATLAYSGTLADGTLVSTAQTTGSSKEIRLVVYSIYEGASTGAIFNKDNTVFKESIIGNLNLVVSPRDNESVIISTENKGRMEYKLTMTTAQAPVLQGTFAHAYCGANYFKYAGHALMATPAEDADGKNIGVALYDITEGLDKAALIKTTNTTLDATATAYSVATGIVKDADITIYLVNDSTISKFTTVGVDQPATPAIMARDLNVTKSGEAYTFTFNANMDAINANLVFFDAATNDYVGKVAIANIKQGANTATVNAIDLPGDNGQALTWAVELEGQPIANWGKLFEDKSLIATGTSRLFNAVNNNPESDKFGYIYVLHRAGSSKSALRGNSGLFEYDYNYTQLNTERYNGGESFGNPGRIGIDNEGYLYLTDWSDDHSGVYVANTTDLTQPFSQFFQGTRESSGAFNNNGAYTGSSTPGCQVFGTGANTKLIVYNEDAKGTLPSNGAALYNIGQADGSILHAWTTAPSAVYTLTGQANTEGNVWGTSHGFFVSQVRSEGANNASATSLKFYDWDGNEQFSAASDEYKEIITGSEAGGYAVSPDESVLILQGGSTQFYVFDITWEGNKPVLTLRYEYKHGIAAIRQMNFDFAGNLICTGDQGMFIFSVPGENSTTIPARKALTVTAEKAAISVTGITLDQTELTLNVTETATLVATVSPDNATDQTVTWSSSNEAVATIADGVVTAVAPGEAYIVVKTTDGNFTDTCTVTVVMPVASVTLDKTELTLNVSETATLTATVLPANATDKTINWSSNNEAVATVADGVVTAVAVGNATITAASTTEGVAATCVVTVNMTEGVLNIYVLDIDAPIYDLLGRQVDKTYKGIVIQNGQKYLLK